MKNQSRLFNAAMFKNYLKTATRNFSKNKFFTTLNVLVLALATIFSQTLKAANTNPVDNLRVE